MKVVGSNTARVRDFAPCPCGPISFLVPMTWGKCAVLQFTRFKSPYPFVTMAHTHVCWCVE